MWILLLLPLWQQRAELIYHSCSHSFIGSEGGVKWTLAGLKWAVCALSGSCQCSEFVFPEAHRKVVPLKFRSHCFTPKIIKLQLPSFMSFLLNSYCEKRSIYCRYSSWWPNQPYNQQLIHSCWYEIMAFLNMLCLFYRILLWDKG